MSDSISRKDAYKVLTDYYHHRTETQHGALKEALSRVPSAEPKKGKWVAEKIVTGNDITMDGIKCNVCGWKSVWLHKKTNYCPHCGAEMEVTE